MSTPSRIGPAFEHNGMHIERARFYAIACDPRRAVAVEACAGAGKTWMLVSRILRALLQEGADACAPHEILAITFTKKAAAEMRQRLDEWLHEFAHATPQQLVQELQLRGMSPDAAQAAAPRLSGLHARLLAGGRPVQFRTFHAWFASLLRGAPLALLQALHLPANYQLIEDDTDACARAWRPFLQRLLEQPEARADYLALVASHGRSQSAKALQEALKRRTEFALADAHEAVEQAVQPFATLHPRLAAFARPHEWLCGEVARARWLAWARALGAEANKTPQKAAAAVIDCFGTGALHDAAVALPRLRAAFFVAGEDRLTQHLKKYPAAQAAETELQLLCAAQAQHEAWAYQQRMTRLTRLLLEAYAQLKRERGWVDMNDVERAAQQLLGNAELWGWVLERLDARIKHLLIDEFQDTNPLQWQALLGWLSSYAGAGSSPPGLFIVGDPKQSIYRFRRAEPQVFIAAQRFVREALGGDLLACDHTRRNAPAVIDVVNRAMAAAQAAGEMQGYRQHSTQSTATGLVSALPLVERPVEDKAGAARTETVWRDSLSEPRVLPEEHQLQLECRQAANWIASRLAAGAPPKEIMVLARRRNRLAALQDELRRLQIPVQQPETSDLHAAPEVQDLVALLDVLVSPAHDLSLARALRSPLWSLDDAALVQLALRQRAQAPRAIAWFDLLQADDLPAPLSGIGAQLCRWQALLMTLPPHDALAAIYHEANVLERFAAAAPAALRASVLANLRGLLAASLALDGARFATPYALVRALRAGQVKGPALAAADAVRLLTVHGAKGLEADAVLLLDCDSAPPKAQTMGALVDWPGEAAAPKRFLFLASEKRPPACCAELLAREQAERQREEINALYVACTRARQQLVLSASQAGRPAPGNWWQRLSPLAQLEPAPDAVPGQAGGDAAFHMQKMPAAPAASAQAAIQMIAPATQQRAADFGSAMHRLLQWAQPGTPLQAAQVQAVAREFGLAFSQARGAAVLAERIRAGQGAWAWQTDLLDWHGNEVALASDGVVLRIDRLVQRRDNGEWWVLDYKSAAAPQRDAALLDQMRGYRQAVRAANPGAVVRAAFLTGQGELVELTP